MSIKVLQPEYMSKFHCIGSKCEDSCCIGWKVDVDKRTYQKYQKIRDAELSPLVKKYVQRQRNQDSKKLYAVIRLDENSCCPFLSDESLCSIQKKYGHEYLSLVCKMYPRRVNKVNGLFERSASTSCPEVARLCLLNEAGLNFIHADESMNLTPMALRTFNTQTQVDVNRPIKYFWVLRIFALNLLQNREYTLSDRLILLGITYKRIIETIEDGELSKTPDILESYGKLISEKAFDKNLKGIPTNLQLQMKLAKELTFQTGVVNKHNRNYLRMLNEVLTGLQYIDDTNLDFVEQRFKINNDKYLNPYIEEKEFILENYVVNEFFKEQMPFGKFGSIWESYVILCIIYGMLKLHLNGVAGYHMKMDDELCVRTIQIFSKKVLHNVSFISNIVKVLEKSELDSLTYMTVLLKE